MSMAPHLWVPLDPLTVQQQFNRRNSPGMTLPESFLWAVWAADGSDYLKELDALHRGSGAPFPPVGTHGDLVDISHVRWATANAITAIDLCAATMGRLFCGGTGPQELDLRYRNSNRRRRDPPPRWRRLLAAMKLVQRHPASNPPLDARSLRDALPREFLDWAKDTLADPIYQELHRARNPLTHSWLTRIPHRGGTLPANRTLFEVAAIRRRPANRKYARIILEDSALLAINRVKAFVEVVNRH